MQGDAHCGRVTAGEGRATVAAGHQRVTREKRIACLQHATAGRVAGSVDCFDLKCAEIQHLAVLEEAVGRGEACLEARKDVIAIIKPCFGKFLIAAVQVYLHAECFFDLVLRHQVVVMSVREDHAAQGRANACQCRPYGIHGSGAVDQHGIRALADQIAVRGDAAGI